MTKGLERRRIRVVAIHVPEQAAQFLPGCVVLYAVLVNAIFCPRFQLVQIPASLGDTHNRDIQRAACAMACSAGKIFL